MDSANQLLAQALEADTVRLSLVVAAVAVAAVLILVFFFGRIITRQFAAMQPMLLSLNQNTVTLQTVTNNATLSLDIIKEVREDQTEVKNRLVSEFASVFKIVNGTNALISETEARLGEQIKDTMDSWGTATASKVNEAVDRVGTTITTQFTPMLAVLEQVREGIGGMESTLQGLKSTLVETERNLLKKMEETEDGDTVKMVSIGDVMSHAGGGVGDGNGNAGSNGSHPDPGSADPVGISESG